ncbi:MAG TPA: hypothetical protein VIJ12_02520 [Candidatus Baltobacteraceae bacterium]
MTLRAEVQPEILARAQADAERLGLPLSHLVSSLIAGRDPQPRPAIDVAPIVLLAHRVAALVDELPPLNAAQAAMVDDLRAHVIDAIMRCRPKYDAQLDVTVEGNNAWE